ncbi:MAG: pre-peptidase C-terminal domain-containing protein [Calditrichaeota bacterium]|nr:pre-peptidase C-terminal domain-containing protein [Calditrichota bacterium]
MAEKPRFFLLPVIILFVIILTLCCGCVIPIPPLPQQVTPTITPVPTATHTPSEKVIGNIEAGGTYSSYTNIRDPKTTRYTLRLVGPTDADFDLYVKVGSAPTPHDYDYRSENSFSNEQIDIPNPPLGTYYWLIKSYQGEGDFTLYIDYEYEIPPLTITHTKTPSPTPSPVPGYLTYSNEVQGFRISYPVDWTKTENVQGATVVFISPLEGYDDTFRENLNVVVTPFYGYVDMESATNEAIEQLSNEFSNFYLIERNAMKLDGSDAMRIVYTGKYLGYDIKWLQVLTIKNNRLYVVSYAAIPGKYNTYLGKVNQMINSFKVI